jgi:small subunit ribosomal protein S1
MISSTEQRELELAQSWAEIREATYNNKKKYLHAQVIGLEVKQLGSAQEECLKLDYKGIYGYLPKSKLDDYDFRSLQNYVGAVLEFVVTENFADGEHDRFFLADRLKALELKANNFWRKAKEGFDVQAFVRGVDSHNVYLYVEGVQVRLNKENFSYTHYADLRDVVFIGEHMEVKITELDTESKTVEVSRKALESDPMSYIDEYKEKSVYLGEIVNVHMDYGIFVRLEPRGIVARTGFPPGMNGELLKVGNQVNFKITGIDEKNRRIKGIIITPRNSMKRKAGNKGPFDYVR